MQEIPRLAKIIETESPMAAARTCGENRRGSFDGYSICFVRFSDFWAMAVYDVLDTAELCAGKMVHFMIGLLFI